MKDISQERFAEFEKFQGYGRGGQILTSDGLHLVCAANDYDPQRIGEHLMQSVAGIKAGSPYTQRKRTGRSGTIRKISDKQYEEIVEFEENRKLGRIQTARDIHQRCAECHFDAEKIGEYYLELLGEVWPRLWAGEYRY